MKLLKKLLLINWHYFAYEVIDFDDINFLTGKTGSGKTTIIDAMQLLFLGDTTGHFFNKSASEKSNRNLKGYLRCEFSDNEDGSALYLRNGRFASYIVCEFKDDYTNESFTVGAVFDNFEDTSYDTKFFIYDGAIPSGNFLDMVNVPFDQKTLRNFLLNRYTNVNFYETNVSYREALKIKLGNLNNSFFSLFKKAIPFSPISNIETFITEYVCDVKSNIDVIKMQENVRSYKSLEIESLELEKRIKLLEDINNFFNNWNSLNDAIKIKKYLLNRFDHYTLSKKIEKLNLDMEDYRNDITDRTQVLENCRQQIIDLNANRDRYVQEKFSSDVYKKRETLQKELETIKQKLGNLESKYASTVRNIQLFVSNWLEALEYYWPKINTDLLTDELKAASQELKIKLQAMVVEEQNRSVSEETMMSCAQAINEFIQILNSSLYRLKNNTQDNNVKLMALNQELLLLSSGQKNYDLRLVSFKNLIENELKKLHGESVNVNFLADLMDIKKDTWRPVIETYLAHQRFYLIVDPKYVDDAIQIYDRYKQNFSFADYGIIDTDKVLNAKVNLVPNSLSHEITYKNDYTRAYVESLIGSLAKCDHLSELRKTTRSITKDGMLYQGFVARQMNVSRTTPFIGSKVSASLLAFKNEEKSNLEKINQNISASLQAFERLSKLEGMSSNEIRAIMTIFEETNILPELQKQQAICLESIAEISDNYLTSLEQKIKKTELTISELEKERIDLTKDIITAQNSVKNIADNDLPKSIFDLNNLKDLIAKEYEKSWILQKGEPAFIETIRSNPEFQSSFAILKNDINNTVLKVQKLWNQVVEARSRYNEQYHINIDTSTTINAYYEEEFSDLHDVKLLEYKNKIAEAKELAIQEFKSDFLSKLKNNFDAVISQIQALNSALGNVRFGEDTYEFIVTPRIEYKKYFLMINDELLVSGKDITSDVFYNKYQETIEDLFRQITFIDTSLDYNLRGELEKNIEKFTDYRSYLKFDLLVKNISGAKQSLARTLQKKSGGETQTPFYIAVLASFGQAYRTHLKNDKNSTIRLIIFDEAFSKMDAERIIESVKLLRKLGLQAIIAAPPEKMPDITPLVDKTLCVIRSNTVSTVKSFKDLNQAPKIK